MSFVPEFSVLVAYSVACFILFATPGPDMSFFLAKTLAGGRQAGLAAMAGALAGCAVHTLLAGLGLSALLAASPLAFEALKVVGALYLLWLAVQAIRHGAVLSVQTGGERKQRLAHVFWTGVGINLTNPKVVLFFVTFLPQFIAPSDPHASGKLMFLGLYFIAFSSPLAILMIVGAERLVDAVKQNPVVLKAINYGFAGVFGAFALKVLMVQGR